MYDGEYELKLSAKRRHERRIEEQNGGRTEKGNITYWSLQGGGITNVCGLNFFPLLICFPSLYYRHINTFFDTDN